MHTWQRPIKLRAHLLSSEVRRGATVKSNDEQIPSYLNPFQNLALVDRAGSFHPGERATPTGRLTFIIACSSDSVWVHRIHCHPLLFQPAFLSLYRPACANRDFFRDHPDGCLRPESHASV